MFKLYFTNFNKLFLIHFNTNSLIQSFYWMHKLLILKESNIISRHIKIKSSHGRHLSYREHFSKSNSYWLRSPLFLYCRGQQHRHLRTTYIVLLKILILCRNLYKPSRRFWDPSYVTNFCLTLDKELIKNSC